MAQDTEYLGAAFSFSLLGAAILTVVYVLQTQFQQDFILAPGTTLLIAVLAAAGTLLFRYDKMQNDI